MQIPQAKNQLLLLADSQQSFWTLELQSLFCTKEAVSICMILWLWYNWCCRVPSPMHAFYLNLKHVVCSSHLCKATQSKRAKFLQKTTTFYSTVQLMWKMSTKSHWEWIVMCQLKADQLRKSALYTITTSMWREDAAVCKLGASYHDLVFIAFVTQSASRCCIRNEVTTD